MFGGDYKEWFYTMLGLQYDQRNSLIVGFVMGFAVIPIIFTISEDALSSVPKHLTAGSLALGANRWQTAMRVVLPTASPGISSAVILQTKYGIKPFFVITSKHSAFNRLI